MRGLVYAVLFCVIQVRYATGSWGITEPPVNTATRLYKAARLNCSVTGSQASGEYIEWTFSGGLGQSMVLYNSKNPSNVKFGYAINGKFDLVIKNVTSQKTGKYTCKLYNEKGEAKIFDAVLSGVGAMQCSVNKKTIKEHDPVTMTCGVSLFQGKFGTASKPAMVWKNSRDGLLPSTQESSAGKERSEFTKRYTTSFKAGAMHDGIPFTCIMSIGTEEENSRVKDYSAEYTDECTTTINVLYGPRDMTVTSDKDKLVKGKGHVSKGDIIKCSANGRPAPQYEWRRLDGNGPKHFAGSSLTITDEMTGRNRYVCVAANHIIGQKRVSKYEITFDLDDPGWYTWARTTRQRYTENSNESRTAFPWTESPTVAWNDSLKVELVNGTHWKEGRVELIRNGIRGTVCDDPHWNDDAARVICRMMGIEGPAVAYHRAYFGRGRGMIWLDDIYCTGYERSIGECYHRGWGSHNCGHYEDAGVACNTTNATRVSTVRPTYEDRSTIAPDNTTAAIVSARLVNGSNWKEGRVEVYRHGIWGTICHNGWDARDARVICRMLGFWGQAVPYYYAHFGQGHGQIWLEHVNCYGWESNIAHCRHRGWGVHNCGHYQDAGVACDVDTSTPIEPETTQAHVGNVTTRQPEPETTQWYTRAPIDYVQLVNGSNWMEGRVEIIRHGVRGTVCDDDWIARDARVICRMLGMEGPAIAFGAAYFGQGTGPIWMDNVNCRGHERSIADCRHNGWGIHDCTHAEDAGVRCMSDHVTTTTEWPFTTASDKAIWISPIKKTYKRSEYMRCYTRGLRYPSYSWQRLSGNGPRGIYGRYFYFHYDALYDEENIYQCTAREDYYPYTTLKTNITFDIEGYDASVYVSPKNSLVMKYNQANFSCEIYGRFDNNDSVLPLFEYSTSFSQPSSIISVGRTMYDRANRFNLRTHFSRRWRDLHLGVKSATSREAGLYRCFMAGELINRYAYLIVLDGYPTCAIRNYTVVETQPVTMTCSVTYKGAWPPRMVWYHYTRNGREEIEGIVDHNDTTTTHTITVVPSHRDRYKYYYCNTFYQAPPLRLTPRFYYDKTAPPFSHTCSVQLRVQSHVRESENKSSRGQIMTQFTSHAPVSVSEILQDDGVRDLRIVPYSASDNIVRVHIGSYIRCMARGNPLPSFLWLKESGSGPKLILRDTFRVSWRMRNGVNRYTCLAQNNVDQKRLAHAQGTISFMVV